jgi:hypothetical protein
MTVRIGKVAMVAAILFMLKSPSPVGATPSSTFWTNCSIDIQAYKVAHITYDNYTTIGQDGPSEGGQQFANDLGLTVGVLPYSKLQMEVAVDWLEPTDHPLFFATKLGAPEGSLGAGAPALQIGVFNVGTEKNVTDQAVGYLVTGRSLPHGLGRLHLSGYWGNAALLRSSDGDRQNTGFMAAYDRGFVPVSSPDGDFSRLAVAGDYASGNNAIGGGGVGMYVYFTRKISLLMGPVWFNDEGLNGDWKWSTQLDVNF